MNAIIPLAVYAITKNVAAIDLPVWLVVGFGVVGTLYLVALFRWGDK